MRISDWSSDVCSSDLTIRITVAGGLCVADLEGALCRPIGAPQLFTVHGVGEGEIDDIVFAEPLDQSRAAGAWRQVGRSEERRVGKECGSTCRSRGLPLH